MAKSRPEELDPRTRELLEGPLFLTLIKLAVPNVLVMVTQIGMALVELYFVAKLGVDALAGVSQVFPVLALVGALSQGAVGGGVVSAIARSLGKGDREGANNLVWFVVAIAIALGLLTTAFLKFIGPHFFAGMGTGGASLEAALTYSSLIFGGATFIWLFNLLLAVVRGTGNVVLPVIVVCGGALLLIPLLRILILGAGPIPGLGVTGGAISVLIYYALGSLILVIYLWSRRGVLHPPVKPPKFRFQPIWEILRVSGMSALVSASTNLTLAILTSFVAGYGAAAVAGYGAGARLEFIIVSLSYGIGGPAGILIGTNIGAGNYRRALRIAWIGVLVAGFAAETIGLAAAIWPTMWLGIFSSDPEVLSTGSAYLRTVGPFFGFFGIGYALYCAGQGTGRMGWPVAGALIRAVVAIAGSLLVLHANGDVIGVFLAAGIGMVLFGCLSLPSLGLRVGYNRSDELKRRHPSSSESQLG